MRGHPVNAMLLINKDNMRILRDRVRLGQDRAGCLEELKKAVEIKSSLQWRAESAVHCVGPALPDHLAWEVKELQEALGSLEEGKDQEAAAKLDELVRIMEN